MRLFRRTVLPVEGGVPGSAARMRLAAGAAAGFLLVQAEPGWVSAIVGTATTTV